MINITPNLYLRRFGEDPKLDGTQSLEEIKFKNSVDQNIMQQNYCF